MKLNVVNFLNKYGMNYQNLDMNLETNKFIEEMEKGLNREGGSLKMIDTYIDLKSDVTTEKEVMVMDAGGTNLRVAKVSFDKDYNVSINDLYKTSMPGVKVEVSEDEFLNALADASKNVMTNLDKLGYCFSYPAITTEDRDAKLIEWTKGIMAPSIVDKKVGAILVDKLESIDGLKREVAVLNDTVATLLGGKGVYAAREFDGFIGFIFGTGVNACYTEDSGRIYNMESGNYANLPLGTIDIEYDKTTNNPGAQLLEKMVSGRYLGEVIYLTLLKAGEEGLITETCYDKLKQIKDFELIHASLYLNDCFNAENDIVKCLSNDDDRKVIYEIIDKLVERAAKICAIKISATILKTNKGKDITKPFAIVCEGSTFFKLKDFKEKFDYYLKDYLVKEHSTYYELLSGEDLNLIGSAIAVL